MAAARCFVVTSETDVSTYFLTIYKFWTSVKDCGDVVVFPTRRKAEEFLRSNAVRLNMPGAEPRIIVKPAGVL